MKVSQIICAGLAIFVLASCQGTRHLQKNEKLLHRQTVKGPPGFNETPLTTLYTRQANRKLLGRLPVHTLVWLYYWGENAFLGKTTLPLFRSKAKLERAKAKKERKFDRKIAKANDPRKVSSLQFRKQQKINGLSDKIENGNLAMQWGEPVSVFDTVEVNATIDRMNAYLFNKGYFLGNVEPRFTEFKRRVTVTYQVNPGLPYRYDSIQLNIPDSAVLALYEKYNAESLVKRGAIYDQDKLTQERERIEMLLKDHGYFDFTRQYITFQVDTTFGPRHLVALRLNIDNPPNRSRHKIFRVDSVSMIPDAGIDRPGTRINKRYHQITFAYLEDDYSERVLAQRIFIAEDSLYSRSNTFATQKQLANLDNFKFVNINYDTTDGRFIANIFASPLDRYSWTNEAGVTVTQGSPGPYYSIGFKKRNIFKGLENFELNGRFGFEGVASATSADNVYQSTEANATASFIFPRFLFPFRESVAYRWGRYNPKTRLTSGYTYTNRPEYTRSAFNLAGIYSWETQKISYSFTALNLNIIQSTLDPDFRTQLETLQQQQGNTLINSFRPSWVSSFIFSVLWNPNNYGNLERSSFFLRTTLESGGTLYNINALEPAFAINRGLEFYKYLRVNVDIRRNEVLNRNTVLAYRINTGIAYAYGDNRTLPYEKFFFAGGSNSVRAWRPRRLGVGSQPPVLSTNPDNDGLFNYQFEKPGDILLEGSIEIRQKVFGFVNVAAFLDAGNVWTFRESVPLTDLENTPQWTGNTRFTSNFYRELGVGTGFGLRLDFSFLVFRFDVGMKVYDPARPEGERFVLNKVKFTRPFTDREPVIYNVGIGYPF